MTKAELPEEDRKILDFERHWYKYAGYKARAIREVFELSPTTYHRRLNEIIETPEALIYDPIQVKRLQRIREFRKRQAADRRLGVKLDANEKKSSQGVRRKDILPRERRYDE